MLRYIKKTVIKLDQFLKLKGVTATGGQAKWMIQGGDVQVNGVLETRRGRQLIPGDQVMVGGKTFEVDESIK
jgi:ribosome-associated protein